MEIDAGWMIDVDKFVEVIRDPNPNGAPARPRAKVKLRETT